MVTELSFGQILLHNKKLKQASCFFASQIPQEKRKEWSESFLKKALRGSTSKLKDTSLFLVLSQNCDIACRTDNIDSAVEVVICKKIRDKDVYAGNSFVKSVRKLQFKVGDNWYEANIDYILHLDKQDLLETIEAIEEFKIISLMDEFAISVPIWRANRYMRSALPDNFNIQLEPVLMKYIKPIEEAGSVEITKGFSSYIKALYVWVDSFEEKASYAFDFFALLRDDTPPEVLTKIQDIIESMASELEEEAGYKDDSDVYAGMGSNTLVSYLTKFVRLNLDSHSLSKGDSDLGLDKVIS